MGSLGTPLSSSAEPESFLGRRMGVAPARPADVDTARATAREAASRVHPRA